ncbi:MAG TPA: ABC transporter ATP-binding protein [Opitutae bacterium]|nr:ABC transporter [Puniceicoccaceae bacterium]HBR93522.1 ABC transporter ATP-binding protein [Opitutae bacterium]|tara:strand:- start:15411 stop:16322 length:912 start_codon:yes stop_codon:yes gene_type:complete
MTAPAIHTRKLALHYGRLEAVRSLDLDVPRRSIYAFLGANGAGKSTTLSMLINTLKPSSGEAMVLGRLSTDLQAKDFQKIGYVAEPQELPDWMTGAQMVSFLRRFYPHWDDDFQKNLQGTLAVPMQRKIAHMSRGEQMKLRLLCSMAYRPELLILDEPFSGLDPLVREELSSGLLELVGEGDWTVILASHDVDDVERLADHAGIIANGRMLFSESIEQLQQRYRRVTALFDGHCAVSAAPKNWSSVECDGSELRFVDDAFEPTHCRAALDQLCAVSNIEERPMSLKEIFVAVSLRQRAERVGA